MKRILRRLRSIRGTSFLEVMVALAITGIITMAIFRTYITQHEQYLIQEDVAEIQQNVRASIDELARHCRMAGFDLPTGMPAIVASDADPDTITLNYRTGDCDTYLSAPMPQPSAELKCATDVSCFEDDDWVYIFEPDSGGGEWFEITHVQEAALHIQHNTMPLSKKYGADAIVMKINQVKFYVDNTTDPDHPRLMVKIPGQNPHIYADNIYDLQFNYRMKNDSVYAEPALVENVREILITVSGRSNQQTGNSETPYRTRTYSTAVSLRNIAIE